MDTIVQNIPAVVNTIFTPYDEGYSCFGLTGRSLLDFEAFDGRISPIIELVRRHAWERYGMLMARFSLATGLHLDTVDLSVSDRDAIKNLFRRYNIEEGTVSACSRDVEENFVRLVRSITNLAARPDEMPLIKNSSQPLRFLFLFEFGEHLLPALQSGTQSPIQLVSSELSHFLANSVSLRRSSHYCVFSSREEGLLDPLVQMRSIRLKQPKRMEKMAFVETCETRYPNAHTEEGLDSEVIANLTSNTPNRGLEALYRASDRTGQPISKAQLIEQKESDIVVLSESTLTLLDTERVNGVDLKGVNIEKAKRMLRQFAEGLRREDPSIPQNILLVGPPGTGKTDLALLTAKIAGVPCLEIQSPKNSFVGESERRAKLQQRIISEFYPNIAFADEITEAFPLQRSENNLDSGASASVTAAFLTGLSDKSRSGRSLFVGSTNCPYRIGDAILNRFMCIPILAPPITDYPEILLSIALSIQPDLNVSPDSPELNKAAQIFFNKGLNPRVIRLALTNAVQLLGGSLYLQHIVFAAEDALPADVRTRNSMMYADWWAIKVCSSRSLLPWVNIPGYVFPDHIRLILDENGEINRDLLEHKINELKPFISA